MSEDDGARGTARRLSRPHPSGGRVIERAAILATGRDSGAVLRWVVEHGEPEALPPLAAGRGLHAERAGAADARRPLRYVVPADALEADADAASSSPDVR